MTQEQSLSHARQDSKARVTRDPTTNCESRVLRVMRTRTLRDITGSSCVSAIVSGRFPKQKGLSFNNFDKYCFKKGVTRKYIESRQAKTTIPFEMMCLTLRCWGKWRCLLLTRLSLLFCLILCSNSLVFALCPVIHVQSLGC